MKRQWKMTETRRGTLSVNTPNGDVYVTALATSVMRSRFSYICEALNYYEKQKPEARFKQPKPETLEKWERI